MRSSIDHISELHHLLHNGYQHDDNSTASAHPAAPQPAPAVVAGASCLPQEAGHRPPRPATATAGLRPRRAAPPAPIPPQHRPALAAAPDASRPAAGWGDVYRYLNQRQPFAAQTAPAAVAPARAPSPPPEACPPPAVPAAEHRRAKRGKPMARRSLQALLDAAATSSSTRQTSATTATEDDADAGGTSATSRYLSGSHPSTSRLNASFPPQGGKKDNGEFPGGDTGLLGPSTPATCDSGMAAANAGPSSCPTSPAEATEGVSGDGVSPSPAAAPGADLSAAASSALLPLLHLLASERGRRLSRLEVKAIVLRVAEDLAALHAADAVHRRVSLATIALTCRQGVAVATLPRGRSVETVGRGGGCHWGQRAPGDEPHAPPEVARCPGDYAAFTQAGDMWGLGVALFSLLSGGRLPFGHRGVCEEEEVGGAASVDALQGWLDRHLAEQVWDVHRESTSAAEAGRKSGDGTSAAGARKAGEAAWRPSTTSSAAWREKECTQQVAAEYSYTTAPAIGFDPEAEALMLGLLRADPAQRLTAADVMVHPWVAEAVPLVPRVDLGDGACGGTAGTACRAATRPGEASPTISDVRHRTENLGFSPGNSPGQGGGDSVQAFPAPPAGLRMPAAPAAVAAAPECPYPIIGHVAQPVEVTIDGVAVTVSALHAVYNVPGHGAMMSAAPVALVNPADVAAALAAANDRLRPAV